MAKSKRSQVRNLCRKYHGEVSIPRYLELEKDNSIIVWENGGCKTFRTTPLMVEVPKVNFPMVFIFDEDFNNWFKEYSALTGNVDTDSFVIHELWSVYRIEDYNDHEKADRLAKGAKLLGDSITEDATTVHIGREQFKACRRFLRLQTSFEWSKGGIF